MGEIQTPAQIATIREVAEAVDYSQFSWPEAALHLCDTVDDLRARLESIEAARRDAQESRFALIVQNEELGAELAATRARLESAEAALRDLVAAASADMGIQCSDAVFKRLNCAVAAARAALGAAGERSEE